MRADLFLYANGHVESRQKAQRLIKDGNVTVDGKALKKPSEEIDDSCEHAVSVSDNEKYVSRGGIKLEGALEGFGISVDGLVCADIGASTGGFTDCLLQRGATRVYAFDSGKDQLHSRIKNDPRVVSKEGFNARFIKPSDVGEKVDLAVMDVSFISQTLLLSAIFEIIKEGGRLVSLVKPQFEAGRAALGKNGIVKNAKDRYAAAMKVLECAESVGFSCQGFVSSDITGGDGNEEYLICLSKSATDDNDRLVWREIIKKETMKKR